MGHSVQVISQVYTLQCGVDTSATNYLSVIYRTYMNKASRS